MPMEVFVDDDWVGLPPGSVVGPGRIIGTNAFATIQEGVNAVDTFGTVQVAPGVYDEAVTIDRTMQLHGAQYGVDARTRPGTPSEESIVTNTNVVGVISITDDKVVVDGFTVQGNQLAYGIVTSVTTSGHWIFNNIIQDNVAGMFLTTSGLIYTQIKRNFFRNNNLDPLLAANGNGIFAQTSSNVIISDNRFTGHDPANAAGINFGHPDADLNIVITNNELINDSSIALANTTNVKIAENTLIGIQGSAIFFGGGTTRTEIESNIIENNVHGIRVTNFFTGTDNTEIRAKHNSIEGNSPATGLLVESGGYSGILDATNNWWGDPSGPSGIGPGTGDSIENNDADTTILFVPFLLADPFPPPPPPTLPPTPPPPPTSAPSPTSPPSQNDVAIECIRTQKVYDWVVNANRNRNKVPIPDDCRPFVDAAIRTGQNITIQCVEPIVPPTFPLIPKPQPTQSLDFSCTVLSIRRESLEVNGNIVPVGIVRFLFGATLLIRIFADGTLLCEFPATIQFDDEIVLCLPEPLDESNVLCRITSVECTPTNSVLLGGMVELEIVICKEVQVEAEVKLEVLAKFCQPRPPIPVPTTAPTFVCPPIVFPPQCPDLFPHRNCDCQGTASALLTNSTVFFDGVAETGTEQLLADICPSCDPGASTFSYTFVDTVPTTPTPTPTDEILGDFSFVYTPVQISSPACTALTGGGLQLVVTATGIRTFTATGTTETLSAELTLSELPGAFDTYRLILRNAVGAVVYDTLVKSVSDANINVQDCITFGDVIPTGVVPTAVIPTTICLPVTETFSNPIPITIPDSGPGAPYPLPILVSGLTGTIAKVTVTLFNISHTFPDDINVLLVGPGGQDVYLMGDVGVVTEITNVTITLDDTAASPLPDEDPLVSGTFRPTLAGNIETFPPPGPGTPTGNTLLGIFNGTNPNGIWNLFVLDDAGEDTGSIAGGWALTISTVCV